MAIVWADRRRWRRTWTGYTWSGTAGAVRQVAGELRREGIAVEVEERPHGTGIRYRNRDRRRVARTLVALGVPPPDRRFMP